LLFLVEGEAAMMVASVLAKAREGGDRALPQQPPARLQHRCDVVEQRPGQLVALQSVAEAQHRRRVRHRVVVQVNPGKAAQRMAVVQRILHRLVGQPVPLLQKVDP